MSKYPGRIVTDLAPAGYSVYFDGTGDSLTISASGVGPTGTETFCFEVWMNASNLGGMFPRIFEGNATNAFQVYLNGGTLTVSQNGGSIFATYALTGLTNQWLHICVTRDSANSQLRLFINGVLRGYTASGGANFASTSIWQSANEGGGIVGYLSNMRVVRGSIPVEYQTSVTTTGTAVFTPPTQLFNITNTSLLTCNSPAIIDQSNNAFAITVNGNSAVSTLTPFTAYVPYNPALGASTPGVWTLDEAMQAKATRQWNMYDPYFNLTTLLLHGNPTNGTTWLTDASTNRFTVTPNGDARAAGLTPFSQTTFATAGSGYLDGTGDWLSIANNAAFDLGTGDCTVECWLYRATSGTLQGIVTAFPSGGTPINGWGLFINTSNFVYMDSWVGNVEQTFTATNNAISTNTWTHIAYTRESGTSRLFVNGQLCTATGPLTQAINTGGFELQIGRSNYGATNYVTGYISNVRIVKGTAVYTSTFTTPTAPLTAITNTSLLTLQNSQSANNNAFLDSSSNNFTITRNGNTTQGSFSPFSQTGWSNFFPTSDNYFGIAGNAAFSFTGDFTVECFVYQIARSDNGVVTEISSYLDGVMIRLGTISSIYDTVYVNGVNVASVSQFVTLNTWTHIAVVRSGTTVTVYVNGISRGTATVSGTVNTTSGAIRVAAPLHTTPGTQPFQGYISNLRILKGTAQYTTGFTPPTVPFTNITNTSLLTCQSNRFVDNSTNNSTITITGTPSVQAFSPFYPTAAYTPQTIGGSGYFDGSGDYLVLPASSAFDTGAGTSDVTFECWVYNNGFSGSQYGRGIFVFYKSTDYNNNRLMVRLDSGSNTINCFLVVNGAVQFGVSGTNSTRLATPFAWTHVALVRSSQTFRLYINGVLDTTLAATTASLNGFDRFEVGRTQDGSVPDFNGNISGFRYLKGTAQYTSAFTPPTTPPTAITNTQLLLNFTNAGVVDSTGKNALETVGNAQISTTQSKFGGSSMYFDGTGDALAIPTPQKENLRFGTGDFTIEFWAWKSANGSTGFDCVISIGTDGNFNGGFAVELSASRGFVFVADAASRVSSNFNPNDSTWHHYAVVRNGNNIALYRDGVQLATAAFSLTLGISGNAFVGAGASSTQINFNGYIDDLRVTRGVARYTGAFTPQTSQWQDQ